MNARYPRVAALMLVTGVLLAQVAAQDQPGDRKRLGKAGKCDLCGVPVKADAKFYSSAKFRTAARAGLRPADEVFAPGIELGAKKAELESGWLKLVNADTTGWACCEACAARVEKHLAPRVPEGDEKSLNEFVALYEKGRALELGGKIEEAVVVYDQAIALAPKAFGGDEENAARLLNNTAMLYHKLGKLAKAEPLYKRSVQISEKERGPDDAAVAKVLDNYGQLLQETRRAKEAAQIFERALKIREKKLPPTHLDLSVTLNNLASAYQSLDRHAEAEPLYQRSLKIAEANGADELPTAIVLDNFAGMYRETSKFAKALNLLKRALAIRERKAPTDNRLFSRTLHQLAEVYLLTADYPAAASSLQRAVEFDKKGSGPDSPDLAQSLAVLGALQHQLGDEVKAAEYFRRELKILEGKQARDHPEVLKTVRRLGSTCIRLGEFGEAESHLHRCLKAEQAIDTAGLGTAEVLSDLGLLYRTIGGYEKAESVGKKALEIRERLLDPTHADVALSLNNLAVLYQSTGRYAQAESHFLRSLKIAEAKKDSNLLAGILNSLGTLYVQVRRDDEGERLLLRALKLKEDLYGRDHPSVAITLDNLVGVDFHRKQWEPALAKLVRALEIRKAKLPADHPSLAVTLHNLGELALEAKTMDLAADFFEQSLNISRPRLGDDHPTVAATLNYLGHVEMARKRYVEAERQLVRSLEIREAKLPKNHPELMISLGYLTDLYAMTGRWDKAYAAADRSQRILRAHSSRVLPYLPEPDQLSFAGGFQEATEGRLSIGLTRWGDLQAAELSATWVVNGKGVIQQSLAERALLAREASGGPLADVVRELIEIRGVLAALSLQPPAANATARQQQLDDLIKRERDMVSRLGNNRVEERETDQPWVELASIRGTIPQNTVLVELARIRPANFTTARLEAARYVAWVIPASGNGDVRLIDLGDAVPIEAAVNSVRQSFHEAPGAITALGRAAANKPLRESLETLAKLILRPLEPHIGNTPNWLISPDADLWLVPWSALPLASGSYSVEKHRISHLVSGRDLFVTGNARNLGLVVMADPDFNLGRVDASKELQQALGKNPTETRLSLRSGDAVRGSWPQLPGTGREAKAIAPLLARYGNATPDIYTERRALEGVFKNLQRPRVLVISTHGYFLEDQDYASASEMLGSRGVYIAPNRQPKVPGSPPPKGSLKPVENPLLRCGLVFAGANCRDEPESTVDDGLLTGLEIVGTDLRGTDLVVLSACETGLGQVRNGEGVAGLRQAFQLAGARTVLATLWKIPDSETADLMTAYFENLSSGWSKADALRRAQLALIKSQREQHGDAHPLFWAGFTLTGDPGSSFLKEPEAATPLPSTDSVVLAIPESRSFLWLTIGVSIGLAAILVCFAIRARMRHEVAANSRATR